MGVAILGNDCCKISAGSSPTDGLVTEDPTDSAADRKMVSTGPRIASRECVGATVFHGLIFSTLQSRGIQVSQLSGELVQRFASPWKD